MEEAVNKNNNLRLFVILLFASALLCIPFVAMRFTGEVNWSAFDFIVAGVLLFCKGLAIEFVLRLVRSFSMRLALCAAILFILFLVWAELAVGIFGTPFAGA